MKKLPFLICMLSFAGLAGANLTDDLLKPYFAIRAKLADDTVKGVETKADALILKVDAYLKSSEGSGEVKEEATRIREGAEQLKGADLTKAREGFKRVSDAMMRLNKLSPAKAQPFVFFCSMAPGTWLQKNDTIGNPYFGKSMLKCGKMVEGPAPKKTSHDHSHHGGGRGGCC